MGRCHRALTLGNRLRNVAETLSNALSGTQDHVSELVFGDLDTAVDSHKLGDGQRREESGHRRFALTAELNPLEEQAVGERDLAEVERGEAVLLEYRRTTLYPSAVNTVFGSNGSTNMVMLLPTPRSFRHNRGRNFLNPSSVRLKAVAVTAALYVLKYFYFVP